MFSNPPCLYDWGWPGWAWYPALALVAAVTLLWLILFRATSKLLHRERSTPRALGMCKPQWALAGLSTALIVLPALAYWQMVTPTPVPVVLLPAPNGYDELKRIGAALADSVPEDIDAATEADLRKFVEDYGPELREVRAALAHESIVPLKYTTEDITETGAIHNIYVSLWADARVAEFDEHCDDASSTYLLMLHLAEKKERGGLLVDWLISLRVLGVGLDGLARLRAGLSSSQLQKACSEVTAIQSRLEPVRNAVARDQVWMEHVPFGWPHRIRFLREPPGRLYESLETYYQAELRLIQCDLAARIYRSDHGRWPDSLNELVPDYVQALPEDPYTQRPFVYRRAGDEMLLYSTGPDKTDNGGVRTTRVRPPPDGEDVTLEPPIARGRCSQPD